jgi:hypothetical protein
MPAPRTPSPRAPSPRARSPYEVVLGDRLDGLHPRLRAYFSAIPPGSAGRGSGVFDAAGWRSGLLARLAGPLHRAGVLLGEREARAPFEVENRPGGTPERPVVRATRRIRHPAAEWTMTDAIGVDASRTRLVDVLGRGRRLRADFDAEVHGGALRLRSAVVRVRLGGHWLRVPRLIAPVVVLEERVDDDRQHVAVELRVPLLGAVYGYRGGFDYRLGVDGGRGGAA